MKSGGECQVGPSSVSGSPAMRSIRKDGPTDGFTPGGRRTTRATARISAFIVSIALLIAGTDGRNVDVCPNERRFGMQGVVRSPNYPQPYARNTCRQWFIQGAPHDVITISFQDLDIPTFNPVGCEGDSFVHIGPDPDRYFCGTLTNQIPRVYISNKSHVWVKFVGSGQRLGRGFDLKYMRGPKVNKEGCLTDEFRCHSGKCILYKWHCNGADECSDGSDEQDCTAIHHVPTPGPWDCGKEKFGCFDINSKSYVCHWNFHLCDKKKDCIDGKDERHCDHLNRVCGGALDGPAGSFSTPNFPKAYPNSVHCEWLIHVTYGSRIQLRFKVFSLENHYDTDYVTVYDGGSDNADVIGRYYGGKRPPPLIESTDNRLFLQFTSNQDSQEQGFQATFQIKGHCLGNQRRCMYGEEDCYADSERCDGKWDCREHGGDERGCGQCRSHLFECMAKGTQCYPESEHCNGISHCSNNKDELNCTPKLCGPHNGTFLCESHQCIYESWRCDNAEDCQDGSDEANCTQPSVKVITAAVIGSLICGLLLVVAIGCTCKLYALRLHEAHVSTRISTPISRLTEELLARRLAPPPYNEAMVTSRPFDEAQREYFSQVQGSSARRSSGHRRSRHSRSSQGRCVTGQGGTDTQREETSQRPGTRDDADDDAPLIDISEQSSGGMQLDATGNDCAPVILSSDCDGDDSDSNCDPSESSNVNISIATGISAQWRRSRRKTSPSSAGTDLFAVVGEPVDSLPSGPSMEPAHDIASIDTASASNSAIISLDGDNSKIEEDGDAIPTCASLRRASHSSQRGSHDHDCSDGESDSSDSADMDTEESLVLVDVHSDTMPLVSR